MPKVSVNGQLIAEVAVERFKVIGESDGGRASIIGADYTIVDVFHIGRLDERVRKILIFWVERMVNPEGTGSLNYKWGV